MTRDSFPRATNAIMVIRLRLATASTTKGLYVSLAGPTKVTAVYSLAQGSNVCKTHPGYRICIIEIHVDSGKYAGTVALYDEAPVRGKIPAGAKLLAEILDAPFTFAPGLNEKHFSIGGIPKALIVTAPSAPAGARVAVHFSVVAEDSSGATIIGPYKVPVTLADGDATGNTSISTSGGDHPSAGELLSSLDVATLHYTGLAFTTAVTITATATGATSGRANFIPTLQPIVFTSSDTLNPNYVGVDLYAPSGPGSTAQFRVTEAGWTNAPFNHTLTIAVNSNPSLATVAQASGVFTATVAGAAPGSGTVTIADPFNQQKIVTFVYTNFTYTGSAQSITVPAGVTKATIQAAGAQGGSGCNCGVGFAGVGGDGGSVTATVPVAPGLLNVLVGGQGGDSSSSTGGTGGFGHGAAGGTGSNSARLAGGGGGGGASAAGESGIFLVVGGGGGGGGVECTNSDSNAGGAGGYPAGADGGPVSPADCGSGSGPGFGGGGTQSSGGAAGATAYIGAGTSGGSGSLAAGGAGGNCCSHYVPGAAGGGGGGGGGYYGGGGGGSSVADLTGGGGGGSSYYVNGATSVTTTNGTQTGNGSILIIW